MTRLWYEILPIQTVCQQRVEPGTFFAHLMAAFKFQIIKLDTKKIYDLVADTEESKQSWIKSVDELISVWLEVEKTNQERNDALKEQANSQSSEPSGRLSGSEPSPVALRALSQSSGSRRGTLSQKSATSSSSLRLNGEPSLEASFEKMALEKAAQEKLALEKRLAKLEASVELLLEENQLLKQRVADLESTPKEGRSRRSTKKVKLDDEVSQDK